PDVGLVRNINGDLMENRNAVSTCRNQCVSADRPATSTSLRGGGVRSDGDRRIQRRVRHLDGRPRRLETSFGGRNILVRDIHLALQSIEFGIAIELPPIASKLRVLRFGLFPVLAFFERRAHWSCGHFVLWPDRAAGKKEKEHKRHKRPLCLL